MHRKSLRKQSVDECPAELQDRVGKTCDKKKGHCCSWWATPVQVRRRIGAQFRPLDSAIWNLVYSKPSTVAYPTFLHTVRFT